MKQISDMLQRTIDEKEELMGHLERYITSWPVLLDDVQGISAFEKKGKREGIMVKVEERTGMKPESETEEKPLYEKPCHFLLCGQLGPALLYGHWIYDHCKNVVQAEGLARKRKIEKKCGGPA
jgi:hypothetical protein